MISLLLAATVAGENISAAASSDIDSCRASIKTTEQTGNNVINCGYMPPPPPRISTALIGRWEGESVCKTGVERIFWDITQGADGQALVRENYVSNGIIPRRGSVSYDSRWSNPLFILTSSTITHYRIVVKLIDSSSLSGQYFGHLNCTGIELRKLS